MVALLPVMLVVAHLGPVGQIGHAGPAPGRIQNQVPHFAIAPACRADLTSRAACRRDEQAARAALRRQWRQFSPAARASCTRLSRIGGDPGYVELLTCLRIDQDANALPRADKLRGDLGVPLARE